MRETKHRMDRAGISFYSVRFVIEDPDGNGRIIAPGAILWTEIGEEDLAERPDMVITE